MTKKVKDWTQIPIKIKTRDKIRKLGSKGDTYDKILNKLMEGQNV